MKPPISWRKPTDRATEASITQYFGILLQDRGRIKCKSFYFIQISSHKYSFPGIYANEPCVTKFQYQSVSHNESMKTY